jgi:WD40 repeat protein
MNVVLRSLVAVVVAMSSLCVRAQVQPLGTADSNDALVLVGKIPVPDMTGTWDHLTVDSATGRLFASAQEDNQVRVFDLEASKPLFTISGGFNRPQGLYYVTGKRVLAVTNGKDGTLRSCDGTTYQPI